MRNFYLKTKDNEVINTGRFTDIDEAVKYFATIKKLSRKTLLSIFLVTDK
jgi:hypothetical protein